MSTNPAPANPTSSAPPSQNAPAPTIRGRNRNKARREPEIFVAKVKDVIAESGNDLDKLFTKLISDETMPSNDLQEYSSEFIDTLFFGELGLWKGVVDKASLSSFSYIGCSEDDLHKWQEFLVSVTTRRPAISFFITDFESKVIAFIDRFRDAGIYDRFINFTSFCIVNRIFNTSLSSETYIELLLKVDSLKNSGVTPRFIRDLVVSIADMSNEDAAYRFILKNVGSLTKTVPIDSDDSTLISIYKEVNADWVVNRLAERSAKMSVIYASQDLADIFCNLYKEADGKITDSSTESVKAAVEKIATRLSLSTPKMISFFVKGVIGAAHLYSQQIITQELTRFVKFFCPTLCAYVGDDLQLQGVIIVTIQNICYEDPRVIDSFGHLVKLLYDEDVLEEDVVLAWNVKSDHNALGKGAVAFQSQITEFVNFLRSAQEESVKA